MSERTPISQGVHHRGLITATSSDQFIPVLITGPAVVCVVRLIRRSAGLVLGSLFQRHFMMTIDRAANRIYMVPDMCGDPDPAAMDRGR